MEIHKVKPIHGWREFFGEVGIIVLGVLIALTAEQLVERAHWRHQIKVADEALTDDFANLVWIARERDFASYCIGQQLDQIAVTLDKAEAEGRLPPIGTFGTVPARRGWSVDSWQALVAANAIAHMPRQKQLEYAGIVNYSAEINDVARKEMDDWSQLATMVGPGRRLSETEAAMLRRARSAAAYDARLLRNTNIQLEEYIKETGLPVERVVEEDLKKGGSWTGGRALHACRPMGPVPKSYNYSMFWTVPMEGPLP